MNNLRYGFLRFSFVAMLFFNCAKNTAQTGTSNLKPTPALLVEDEYGEKQLLGWTSIVDERYSCRWENGSGNSVWHQELNTENFNVAMAQMAKANGFQNVEILASYALKNDIMFDEKGEARTIIASGIKNAEKYRVALLLFYGRLFEEERSMGIHGYAAPESSFISSGGWVVPATFWLGVDPEKDVGNLIRQGSKSAKDQAEIFGKLSDIWIESMYNLYVNQMQMNVQALHNLRISTIAAGDPNAIIVLGTNGYNEIEYQN